MITAEDITKRMGLKPGRSVKIIFGEPVPFRLKVFGDDIAVCRMLNAYVEAFTAGWAIIRIGYELRLNDITEFTSNAYQLMNIIDKDEVAKAVIKRGRQQLAGNCTVK